MNYKEFKNKFQNLPLILSKDVVRGQKDPQVVRNQLNRWQKSNRIIKLRRGIYLLNENDRKVNPDKNVVANMLYSPSYLSMEYALNFYGLIPEGVVDATSITTRKTKRFNNVLGSFIYQHVNCGAFRNFKSMKAGAFSYFIAEPEKAVADFLYLNLGKCGNNFKEAVLSSWRFQNLESLSESKFVACAELFHSKKLMRIVKKFCEIIEEERR